MRIILLAPSNSCYANIIIKEMIGRLKHGIAMVIESDLLIPGRSLPAGAIKYINSAGFKYFFIQAFKQGLFIIGSLAASYLSPLPDDSNFFYSYRKMAKRYGIPVIKTDNINSPAIVEIMRKLKPDLIVSVYFRQILGERILRLPKKGCLNIHPALLPSYRGVSPIFWALAFGEKRVGVTIHFMDEQIDHGDIVSQKAILVDKEDMEHLLFLKASLEAVPMLLDSIKQIENDSAARIKQDETGPPFSLPTRDAVERFEESGRRFFSIHDLLNNRKIVSDVLRNR